MLSISAFHLAVLRGNQDFQDSMEYYNTAVGLVSRRLEDSRLSVSDEKIAAVALLPCRGVGVP